MVRGCADSFIHYPVGDGNDIGVVDHSNIDYGFPRYSVCYRFESGSVPYVANTKVMNGDQVEYDVAASVTGR